MLPTVPDGLTTSQAKKFLEKYGPNLLPEQAPDSSWTILIKIVREPMIFLLIIGGGLYLFLGDTIEAILLLAMIAVIAVITFIQEKKTQNALGALKQLASPRVKVIRSGQELVVPGSEIVPGDVVKVGEGDRIPADGQVIFSENLYLDEATITGESLPVAKKPNESVFSSALVTSGWAFIKITHTGIKTKIGEIGHSLNTIADTPTRMQLETKAIVSAFALFGLITCLLAFTLVGIFTKDWANALLQGIAIAMSLLPEEFPVVLTIFTALGALHIAHKKVLMTNLPTLETLGSATVLCTDKTGTLTQNRMSVTGILAYNGNLENPYQTKLSVASKQVLNYARYACHTVLSDNMEFAIDSAWKLVATKDLPQLKEISSLKTNHTFMINQVNRLYIAKGAPESILKLCRLHDRSLVAEIEIMAKTGSRVIAVASSPSLNGPFTYHGLICLSDPIRPKVNQAIHDCTQAGIRVLMITGDYPETAQYIGQSIGLSGTDNVLTGAEISKLSSKELKQRLSVTNICARIMPTQKLAIVNALKANREIVAMTGDGVNDAAALKAAHMGIAMGLHGTDVAREASDMVLTDDNFTSIVNAIKEGRRIFSNIRKAMGFIIAVHVPISVLAIIPIIFGWPSILTPIHIVILELLIDPTCTLVFENEPAEADIMSKPPRPTREKLFSNQVFIRALVSGLVVAIGVISAYLCSIYLKLPVAQIRQIAFFTLIMSNLGLILSYRSTSTSVLKTLITPNRAFWLVSFGIISLILLLSLIKPLQTLFGFASPTAIGLSISLSFSLISLLFEVAISKFTSKIGS